VTAWQALHDRQQGILMTAHDHLDAFMARQSPAGARSEEVTYSLGLSADWDDSMKSLISSWYESEGWHRVRLGARGGELVIHLSMCAT